MIIRIAFSFSFCGLASHQHYNVCAQPSCKCHALRDIALLDAYSNLFYGQLQKMTHQALIFDLISQ